MTTKEQQVLDALYTLLAKVVDFSYEKNIDTKDIEYTIIDIQDLIENDK